MGKKEDGLKIEGWTSDESSMVYNLLKKLFNSCHLAFVFIISEKFHGSVWVHRIISAAMELLLIMGYWAKPSFKEIRLVGVGVT